MQPIVFDYIEGIPLSSRNPCFFGHQKNIDFLQKMHGEEHLHHALLFEGLRGVGKATLAFHFAWNILADHGKRFICPDALSPVWRKIGQGAHPGLLYISRGFDTKTQKFRNAVTVDDIRQVTRFLQQTSVDNGWRIIIIDSADDMNRNAANALLKTLEEPPVKTLFVLVSHSSGRLLPTIRSRCQSVTFKPLADIEMQKVLCCVAKTVGFNNEDTLHTTELITRSEGSVRQAILILISGGFEIIRIVDDILFSPDFPVASAHRLASSLSGRDSVLQFDFFLDCLMKFLAETALKAALSGQSGKAGKFSRFWQKIQHDTVEALAYNLDKKQLCIILLQKIHSFLYRKF